MSQLAYALRIYQKCIIIIIIIITLVYLWHSCLHHKVTCSNNTSLSGPNDKVIG